MQTYRHPHRWLFVFWVVIGCLAASSVSGQVIPAKTTIHDVVYRADGMPASGEALISWPAFTTADGAAVAAGSLSVPLKTGGVLDAALVPNIGSLPASTFYTVVFHLDDGKSSTEYWSVPSGTTVRIADIRSKIVPQSVAVQTVSRDYVTQSLKPLAQDTAVLHRTGDEDVAGAKNFNSSPIVPTPQSDTQAANKRYVDDAIHNLNPSSLGMISAVPSSDQSIAQPAGTALKVNRISATTLNGIRFADQFPTIQAAVTDAGTTGSVTIPSNYAGTDRYTNPNNISINDLRGKPDRQKGFINAVTDCGVPTDATSDVCSSLQACIDNNQGARIGLPQLVAPGAGAVLTPQNYYSSCKITLKGNGNRLIGFGGPPREYGGVRLHFASGVGGITTGTTCKGCGVENLMISSADLGGPNVLSSYQDWTSDAVLKAGTYDGIFLQGGAPYVDNVQVEGFRGNGVTVNGDSGGVPDKAHLKSIRANGNGGCGILLYGIDANVAMISDYDLINNNVCGWRDNAFYGNLWMGGHTAGNTGLGKVVAGSNQPLTSISASGGVCTATLTNAFTGSIGTVGTWVTITGTSNGTGFNSATYSPVRGSPGWNVWYTGTTPLIARKVTATNPGAKTVTYDCSASGGPATGGNIRTASNDEVLAYYAKNGIRFGSMVSDRGASSAVVLNGYQEGNQAPIDFSPNPASPLMLGGNVAPLDWAGFQGHRLYTGSGEVLYLRTGHFFIYPRAGGVFAIVDPSDAQQFSVDLSGNTMLKGKLLAGVNPANSALTALGIPNSKALMSRNAANTADIYLVYADSSNRTNIGDAAGVILNTTVPATIGAAKSGTTSNSDIAGQITLSGGSATYTFGKSYASAPICVATDTTATAAVKVTTTTTTLTLAGTGSDVVNYICMGRT
jgi:hypothetical protein